MQIYLFFVLNKYKKYDILKTQLKMFARSVGCAVWVQPVKRELGEKPMRLTVAVCVPYLYLLTKVSHWETEKAEYKYT